MDETRMDAARARNARPTQNARPTRDTPQDAQAAQPAPTPHENSEQHTAHGIAQLEGYLLWNAEVAEAHRQARDFADRLPWLTSTQREEVERVYADDRITVSRGVLTRIAGRAGELRSEYSAAYRQLRLRCALSLGLTGTALLSFALTLVVLARRG